MRILSFSNQSTKSLLFLVLFVFISFGFTNQETVWLDEDLNETNQTKATYYTFGKKKEGSKTYYYKSRTIYRKVIYKNGKLDGKFYEYYYTGELKEAGSYENGLREGNWKEFYKSGKILRKGKYANGEKVGIWKTFYKNEF